MSGATVGVMAAQNIASGGGGLGFVLGAHTAKNGAAVTTLTTDAVTTAASGSLFIIAVVYGTGSGVTSVSDSKSNTYTEIGAELFNIAKIRWWRCEGGTGGGSHTATANFGSAEEPSVFFFEFGGCLTSGALDQQTSIGDSATPFAITSGATTQADEVVFGFMGSGSGDNPATKAESTGHTIIDQTTNGSLYWTGVVTYEIVAATGAQALSFTDGSSSGNALKVATFRKA